MGEGRVILSSFRKDIARFYLTRFSRDNKSLKTPFSVGKSIESSSGVLICMPDDLNQFRVARYVFKKIFESPASSRVTVILTEETNEEFKIDTNAREIVIKNSDISFWQLPKSNWISDKGLITYDLTVDLNTDFCLYAAYICRAVGHKLLIGFAWEGADQFYNILLKRTGNHSNLEKTYRTIRDEFTNLIPLEQKRKDQDK
ncbi:MAG: hypothetical protein IH880_09770 [Candidatus Marinimicrobia bacterium]|nr:hypothetical protein [Candidatus Neomarinimicrobiota bacterium]